MGDSFGISMDQEPDKTLYIHIGGQKTGLRAYRLLSPSSAGNYFRNMSSTLLAWVASNTALVPGNS
jgi:hypothetical protein